MNIEEQGKEFATSLCDLVTASGVHTQLDTIEDAFLSGCYFGAVQGYKKGVNTAVPSTIEFLPVIFNKIAASDFNMNINWKKEYMDLVLTECYDVPKENIT